MANHRPIIANDDDTAREAPRPPGDVPDPAQPALDPVSNLFELSAEGAAGERLDRFLAERLPQFSRTRLQRWIELGAVSWDERVLGRRYRLAGIETLVVEAQPREADSAFGPEPVEFDLVHEDAALLIIDKRAGLVVHPGSGNWHGTLLNGLLHRFGSQAALARAGIVHRLDKDTSGLMVVARSEEAMADLGQQLALRTMGRRYLALVNGVIDERGSIDEPIGRDPAQRTRMAVVHGPGGRPARTLFRRLALGRLEGRPVSVVECRLHTGRTHQIRVHLRHLRAPIVGDLLYGGSVDPRCNRQALHAWRLELTHPQDRRGMVWKSPLPKDFRELLEAAGIEPARVWADALQRFDDPGRSPSP